MNPYLEAINAEQKVGTNTLEKYFSDLLGAIPAYTTASFEIAEVNLLTVALLVDNVIEERLRNAQDILDQYVLSGIPLFSTAVIKRELAWEVIFPPVVEIGGLSVIVDGVHRAFVAKRYGATRMRCVVVTGSTFPPLPCRPRGWGDLSLVEAIDRWTDRITDLDERFFRPVAPILDARPVHYATSNDALRSLR
jgi:hypothetical protein